MSVSQPFPLATSALDVRGYDYMPVYGDRLFTSDFYAEARRNPRGGLAAQKLWWVSWQQVPAGSLPANEFALCGLADFGSDMRAWKRARAVAMHGFVLCSDGRYYHPVVVEAAEKALRVRVKERDKKARQRAAKDAASRDSAASEREQDANMTIGSAAQAAVLVENADACPAGRPAIVPPEGKVSNSVELRSTAAGGGAGQGASSLTASGSISEAEDTLAATGTVSGPAANAPDRGDRDLFGDLPSESKRPSLGQAVFGEGLTKLAAMTGKKPDALRRWLAKARQAGTPDAVMLAGIQEAHLLWLSQDAELADPISWITAFAKARTAPAPRELPAEVNGWVVADVIEECQRLLWADLGGCWEGKVPTILVEALEDGADAGRHIYPVMRNAKLWGLDKILTAGWFRKAIQAKRAESAAA